MAYSKIKCSCNRQVQPAVSKIVPIASTESPVLKTGSPKAVCAIL